MKNKNIDSGFFNKKYKKQIDWMKIVFTSFVLICSAAIVCVVLLTIDEDIFTNIISNISGNETKILQKHDDKVSLANPSPTKLYAPIISVVPKNTTSPSTTITPVPTPTKLITPTPTVFINPGIRDNKFTDKVIHSDMSYSSDDISIEINKVKRGENVMYIAEIYLRTLDNFMPVFAGGEFDGGYATTGEMADEHDAILAINSDSATAVDYGIIIRNGEIFQDEAPGADHLTVKKDGSLVHYEPKNIDAKELLQDNVVHAFCFGPSLFFNGGNVKIKDFSLSHIKRPHPRTAIGMVEPYHYYFVVVDGRESGYSVGMTLAELAIVMDELDCSVAYNLDGGGSSTMIFMGELINRPEGNRDQRAVDSAILIVEN